MKTINTLQAGRALAALAVTLHHAAQSAKSFGEGQFPDWLEAITKFGYLGVDFFFVLSGFIIYYTSKNMTSGRAFFGKRLRRIFVPYLPVALVLAAAYILLPSMSQDTREWGWFTTLTLLPSPYGSALGVAWTLQHEIVFYAIFAVCLLFRKIGIGMGCWMAAIAAFTLLGGNSEATGGYLLAPINIEFAIGILAARCVMEKWRIPSIALWLAAALAIFTFFVPCGGDRAFSVFFGLGIAFVVIAFARHELADAVIVPKGFVFLGAASYAIYLLHNPVVSIGSRIVGSHGWLPTLLADVAAAIVAGCAYHLIWERPVLGFLNRKLKTRAEVFSD